METITQSVNSIPEAARAYVEETRKLGAVPFNRVCGLYAILTGEGYVAAIPPGSPVGGPGVAPVDEVVGDGITENSDTGADLGPANDSAHTVS